MWKLRAWAPPSRCLFVQAGPGRGRSDFLSWHFEWRLSQHVSPTVSPASCFLGLCKWEMAREAETSSCFTLAPRLLRKSQDRVSEGPFISWGLSAWLHGRGRWCWNLEAMEGFPDGLNKGVEVESNESSFQYSACIGQG